VLGLQSVRLEEEVAVKTPEQLTQEILKLEGFFRSESIKIMEGALKDEGEDPKGLSLQQLCERFLQLPQH
jgi:hypothetical protein